MNIKNCRKCGKVFNYVAGPPICQACKELAEKKFVEVKEFVRQNKTANMHEISANCDVEERQVEQWVREERLVFAENSPIKIFCESCGATILTGRYCDKCKKKQANTFEAAGSRPEKSAPQQQQSSGGARMYSRK